MRCLLVCALASVAVTTLCAEAAGPAAFDGARAFEHVRQVVGFGPRPPGSEAIAQTRQYLKQQMAALGLQTIEQPFDAATPLGTMKMVNVRVVIPGARPERLVIGGHYDTKIFKAFRFVGANDGGSSTGFLIELARVLKDRKNPLTIELVWFDGEEAVIDWTGTDHTYGSRHYVEAARRSGALASIKGMVLVDMIGERDLNIRRESMSTPWMADAIWQSARTLGYGRYFPDDPMPVEDDHVAFLRAGVPAVNIIDLDYAVWHTAGDTLDQVSARSLEIVGTVLMDALPAIERRLAR